MGRCSRVRLRPLPPRQQLGLWDTSRTLTVPCIKRALQTLLQVLGSIPEAMALRADRNSAQCFVEGRLDWPEGAASRKSIRAVGK